MNRGSYYQAIAAGQTDVVLKNVQGGVGDFLHRLTIIPATTTPGNVIVEDGAGAVATFVFGTLPSTAPLVLELGWTSRVAAWQITTGANVAVVASGDFR